MKGPQNFCVRALVLLFVAGAIPHSAFAINYVTNGQFNSNLDGWTIENPWVAADTVNWSSLDASGVSTSGSVRITTAASTDSVQGKLVTQCGNIPGGLPYDLVLRYHIAPGQGVVGYAQASLSFFDEPSCGGSYVGGRFTASETSGSGFASGSVASVWAPSTTKSFKIALLAPKRAGGAFTAEFDDVALYPVTGGTNANLLANPHFDQSATGWTVALGPGGAGTLTFTSFEGGTSATPRAAVLTNTSSGYGTFGIVQCVAVAPGAWYDAGARLFVPAGQANHGYVHAAAFFFSGDSCGGTFLGSTSMDAAESATGRYVARAETVTAPAGSRSAQFTVQVYKNDSGGSFTAYADDAWFAITGACVPSETNLCLDKNRFRVSARYETPAGESGDAHVVQLTSDSGYLWFFNESNIEAIVKVLDGCGVNLHHWGFAGGLTNVKVTTKITDTLSGYTKTYINNQNAPFQPLQDTVAFSTCP